MHSVSEPFILDCFIAQPGCHTCISYSSSFLLSPTKWNKRRTSPSSPQHTINKPRQVGKTIPALMKVMGAASVWGLCLTACGTADLTGFFLLAKLIDIYLGFAGLIYVLRSRGIDFSKPKYVNRIVEQFYVITPTSKSCLSELESVCKHSNICVRHHSGTFYPLPPFGQRLSLVFDTILIFFMILTRRRVT